ncbi:MAG: GIY-YIG nuclease family protein [Dolichospermum sp.]|jgi:hypothetical protein|nr:GIY-YIG nuclease family protein [Anabaena sp. 49628_E55]
MDSLAVFQFDSQEIRFVDGKPVANDVNIAIEYNCSKANKCSDKDLYECYTVYDLLAIVVEFTEELEVDKTNKVFEFIKRFNLVNDATSERLYHATRIHWAWQTSRIDCAEKRISNYVYLIECKGNKTLKIGFSCCPEERMKTLQTTSPYELKLIAKIDGDKQMEKKLHKEFSHLLIRNEWFKWSKEIIDRFTALSQD